MFWFSNQFASPFLHFIDSIANCEEKRKKSEEKVLDFSCFQC